MENQLITAGKKHTMFTLFASHANGHQT